MDTCPNCGTVTDDNVCPSCGFELNQQDSKINHNYSQSDGAIPETDNLEEPLSEEPIGEGITIEQTEYEETSLNGDDTKAPQKNDLKRKKWVPVLGAILLIAIVYFAFIQPKVIKPMQDYNYAIEQLDNGNIAEAKKIFTSLGDYKDAVQQIDNCEVALGDKRFNDGEYELALEIYEKYRDNANVTVDKINKCKEKIYQSAITLLENGNAESAKKKFEKIKDYSNSKEYIEKCDEAIEEAARKAAEEKAAKEAAEKKAAEKKAAEKKAAEERAAKYGKLDSSLEKIMKEYMDNYSSIHGFSSSTSFGAKLNLYYKDNAYGGVMSCSPSKNSVTVMFQGMDESGSAEADVNDIPGSIMTFFYFNGEPELEDLMCMISAEGNLLCAIDPSIEQDDTFDPVRDAYVDEEEVSYKGFKITSTDLLQSQGVIIFKVSSDK